MDDWGAYCYDKSWGSCPVTCTDDQLYCYSSVYDSTGQVDDVADVATENRGLKCCEAMMSRSNDVATFWTNMDFEGFHPIFQRSTGGRLFISC